MLLAEYAVTPDVFDSDCYASEELCAARLENIREALLSEGIVRDLRNGAWSQLFKNQDRQWHRRAKELVRKLASQNRMSVFTPQLSEAPMADSEWCAEALATHEIESLAGIIVTDSISSGYKERPIVAPINKLGSAPWWSERSPSMRLNRTFKDYRNALSLILRKANSIMFIDPHLDPTQPRYQDFVTLLKAAGSRSPTPVIEIHRVCYHGSGKERQIDVPQLEADFRNALTEPLTEVGLNVEIFVWDDFHDRYVLSDLVGISLPNGFDTKPNSTTTWARLGRSDRDDVQKEFDEASHRHKLQTKFTISSTSV